MIISLPAPARAGRAEVHVEIRDVNGNQTKIMTSRYAPPPPQSRNAPEAAAAPVKTLRLGRIKAAIWENGADQRTFYNVTFARSYMGEDKKWRDTDSFGRDDLLVLSKLADQAHTCVCERLAGQKADEQA